MMQKRIWLGLILVLSGCQPSIEEGPAEKPVRRVLPNLADESIEELDPAIDGDTPKVDSKEESTVTGPAVEKDLHSGDSDVEKGQSGKRIPSAVNQESL